MNKIIILVLGTLVLVTMSNIANAWVPQETRDKLTNDEMSYLNDVLEKCYNKFRQYGISPCAALNEESIKITAGEHDNSTVDIPKDIPLSEYCKLKITSIAEKMCKEAE